MCTHISNTCILPPFNMHCQAYKKCKLLNTVCSLKNCLEIKRNGNNILELTRTYASWYTIVHISCCCWKRERMSERVIKKEKHVELPVAWTKVFALYVNIGYI